MKRCLIVGKPNVGKTLFFLNFAHYMGLTSLKLRLVDPDGTENELQYSIERAKELFVGETAHTTKRLQSITLHLPAGKGKRELVLIDTSGLTEHIHEDRSLRRAMAQTLHAFRQAEVVLHIIDVSTIGREDAVEAMGELDLQLARYGPLRVPYLILANKMDLPWAHTGLRLLTDKFSAEAVKITPISALKEQGFREVQLFLQTHV
jgi:GTPase Era involved in 16S rRNA processing